MSKLFILIGIVVVAILVAGCTQSTSSNPPVAQSTPLPTTSTMVEQTGGQSPQVSVSPGSIVVPTTTPVVIPTTGVYVYVDYLGSFSGSYGSPVNPLPVRDSGERLYLVDAVNGTVSAGFAKLDGSSYPLTVKIYSRGTLINSGTSSDPYGMVNITGNT